MLQSRRLRKARYYYYRDHIPSIFCIGIPTGRADVLVYTLSPVDQVEISHDVLLPQSTCCAVACAFIRQQE